MPANMHPPWGLPKGAQRRGPKGGHIRPRGPVGGYICQRPPDHSWFASLLGPTKGRRGAPKPYKFIGFGDIHGPKPCKLIGFGDMHGPKPCKLIGSARPSVGAVWAPIKTNNSSFLGPEGLLPLCCPKSDESLRFCIRKAFDFEGLPKPGNPYT